MDSIEFTINKSSKQHENDIHKIEEFIGDKSIFINNNNKVIVDIPVEKLQLSINKLPIIKVDGNINKKGSICTTYKQISNEAVLRFEIGKIIGKGGYGTVYEATLLGGYAAPKIYINQKIIIKVQDLYNNNENNLNLLKEILIHLILNSDIEIYKHIPVYIGSFRLGNKVGFIMQYSGKNTLSSLLGVDYFNNNNITSILLQTSKIIEIMQKKYSFIHGDFKPNNLMVYSTKKKSKKFLGVDIKLYGYTVKIIDFGFSTIKTKRYIIKSNPYTKHITNKFYIDLLFLSINLIRILKRNNKTQLNIYKKLYNMLNDIFKKIKLNIQFYLKSNLVKNKKIKTFTNLFKIDITEFISGIDILYDIIDMTLYINNNNNNIFNDFLPNNFYLLIIDALE